MGKDKLDVMAPGVDCGEGCVVQQRKHGQVVAGFVFVNIPGVTGGIMKS